MSPPNSFGRLTLSSAPKPPAASIPHYTLTLWSPTPQIITLCHTGLTYHFIFLTFGHCGTQLQIITVIYALSWHPVPVNWEIPETGWFLYMSVMSHTIGKVSVSNSEVAGLTPKLGTDAHSNVILTLSPPISLRLYTFRYWSHPHFQFLTFGRSGAQSWVPECQKLK